MGEKKKRIQTEGATRQQIDNYQFGCEMPENEHVGGAQTYWILLWEDNCPGEQAIRKASQKRWEYDGILSNTQVRSEGSSGPESDTMSEETAFEWKKKSLR